MSLITPSGILVDLTSTNSQGSDPPRRKRPALTGSNEFLLLSPGLQGEQSFLGSHFVDTFVLPGLLGFW